MLLDVAFLLIFNFLLVSPTNKVYRDISTNKPHILLHVRMPYTLNLFLCVWMTKKSPCCLWLLCHKPGIHWVSKNMNANINYRLPAESFDWSQLWQYAILGYIPPGLKPLTITSQLTSAASLCCSPGPSILRRFMGCCCSSDALTPHREEMEALIQKIKFKLLTYHQTP